ncbi:hypothetical protein YQE_03018, partial [Dendroctonus ponderosae]
MLPRRRRTGSESENLLLSNERSRPQEDRLSRVNSGYPNNVTEDYYLEEDHIEDFIEPEPIMSARDRTSEFINTIQTLQGRNIARAVAVKDPRKSRAIQSHSEFMLIAKNVGKNLASTYAKLEKLTLCTFEPLFTFALFTRDAVIREILHMYILTLFETNIHTYTTCEGAVD